MNQRCRVCGCTDDRACVSQDEGPCYWVEEDLCSACVNKKERVFPLKDGEELIRTEEGCLFIRSSPGGMPLLTDPNVVIDEVLECYWQALEELKSYREERGV